MHDSPDYCVCPEFFLTSTDLHAECEKSFGAMYPDSIGKEETSESFGSCKNRVIPTITLPNGTTATPVPLGVTASSTAAASPDSDEKPTWQPTAKPTSALGQPTGPTDGSNTSSTAAGASRQTPSPPIKDDGLSALEIVGIIAGVISALIAVLGAFNFRRVKIAVETRRTAARAMERIG